MKGTLIIKIKYDNGKSEEQEIRFPKGCDTIEFSEGCLTAFHGKITKNKKVIK